MNKIYKVVWNAARNSYMVGSEFIRGSHSAGSRRISGRKLKGLVAAALLASAILSPAGLMPASAFGGHGGYEKNYVTKGQLNEESSARKDADKNLQGQINGLETSMPGTKPSRVRSMDWNRKTTNSGEPLTATMSGTASSRVRSTDWNRKMTNNGEP